jgi:hypothetical protein
MPPQRVRGINRFKSPRAGGPRREFNTNKFTLVLF